MAIRDDDQNTTTSSDPVRAGINPAEPQHAEHIVSAFNEEYLKYYGKYVNEKKLRNFIDNEETDPDEVQDESNEEELPEELIWAVENEDNQEFVGAGAIKFDDNLAELGSTIIVPEYRSRKNPDGDGVYDELFRERLEVASNLKEAGRIDLVNTQLLADKSAATQHTADKYDFAVTGVYDKKFPIAYEGKGRVTVVDMLWADSRIENSQEEVYVPDDARDFVNTALDNIEGKRSENLESITRDVLTDGEDSQNQSYKVKAKAVDEPEEDPMNFAEVSVVADDDGDYTWTDVLAEIGEAQEQVADDDDYWVGVSLDVNDPTSIDAASELSSLGFEYAGFNPGKLEAGDENRDALELQYRPSDETYVKQFVNEAVDFMEESGMDYQETEVDTDYDNSQPLEV